MIVHEAPRTAGFGAELAALIAERAIFDLQGPVLRVTGYDVPYPYWTIEDAYMPSVERVAAAVRTLVDVIHELPLERRTLHGHFSRDLEPVLDDRPGRLGALRDAERRLVARRRASGSSRGRRRRTTGTRSPARSRFAAPAPGRRSSVRIDEVVPGPWGETLDRAAAPDPAGSSTTAVGARSTGQVVELRPFLGVLGMPPLGHGVHSTTPPRPQGGNIDCKELVAGSTLYLPIPVDGALFSAGDGHARQGDGEVSGTAIECPRAQVTLDVRDDLARVAVRAHRRCVAHVRFDEDRAARKAVDGMLDLMSREHGLAGDALARKRRRRPARHAGRERRSACTRVRDDADVTERSSLARARPRGRVSPARRGDGERSLGGSRSRGRGRRRLVRPEASPTSFDPARARARAGAGERARPERVGIWNETTLQAGYVPRERPELAGTSCVSLWRAGEGCVLLVRPDLGRASPQVASTAVPYEFKLPDLGEGLTEGEIARWLVAEGDEIAEDQPLVEIQTDKTTVEIPSPAAGTVTQILVAEGDVVPVGTVLVVIGGDAAAAQPSNEAPPAKRAAQSVPGCPADSPRACRCRRRRSSAASRRNSASTWRRSRRPARAAASPRTTSAPPPAAQVAGRSKPPRGAASRCAAFGGRSSST